MALQNWEPRHPIPFVVFVSPARDYVNTLSGEVVSGRQVDFLARMILLGEMHKTYAGSVTCVTGAAAAIDRSVVSEVAHLAAGQKDIRIGHPGGIVTAGIEMEKKGEEYVAKQISYGRTARRIMDGFVYVPKARLEA